MIVNITEVRKGDIIVEGRDQTKVDHIQHSACSSFGTHVNHRECYERGAKVSIKVADRATAQHFEESGLGDLEEDYLENQMFDEMAIERIIA